MRLDQISCELEINTIEEGFTNITKDINHWIKQEKITKGILHLMVLHTSASLTINENADSRVLYDLSNYIQAIVPQEGFKKISGQGSINEYTHADEGPDDMPAHIRTALTNNSLNLSIEDSLLKLGTWQAIYLWEHRRNGAIRKVNLHFIGEFNK